LSETLEELRVTADELTVAIDQDAASYDAVMAAFKLPQGNDQEIAKREASIQEATKGAAEVPLRVAERAARLNQRLLQLERIAAASMKSDLQVARLMAVAAAKGALANVEINLEGLKDTATVGLMKTKVAELRTQLG
jgi:methenyltetrahydrofolate cyclohydrolase